MWDRDKWLRVVHNKCSPSVTANTRSRGEYNLKKHSFRS
ncbi:hypothetical protein DET60_101127 [Raoultella planticola]|nr:hypothetical protein DET60_101127 [Raoultella planticola]SPZ32839.1 Uncharacterised protein [Raoultella planticola]